MAWRGCKSRNFGALWINEATKLSRHISNLQAISVKALQPLLLKEMRVSSIQKDNLQFHQIFPKRAILTTDLPRRVATINGALWINQARIALNLSGMVQVHFKGNLHW